MSRLQINLASRPFTNHTLYHVGYVVIGLVGLLLLAHNAIWFFSNHGDVREMEQEISSLQTEVDQNIREAGSLAEQVEQVQRNRRFREVVAFVDGRIRQRRFSWIRMLNLLQEAIPPQVKIESITPRVQQDSIRITLACMAKQETAVNEFIENLEDVDEFDRVLITSEDREGNTVLFPLTMEYSPFGFDDSPRRRVGEEAMASEAGTAPEPGSLEEAVSLARLPDPETEAFTSAGEGEAVDPFSVVEGDMFTAGDDIFAGMDDPDSGWTLPPPDADLDPPPDAAAGSSAKKKQRASGALIKLPPSKPGDRNRRSGGGGK